MNREKFKNKLKALGAWLGVCLVLTGVAAFVTMLKMFWGGVGLYIFVIGIIVAGSVYVFWKN